VSLNELGTTGTGGIDLGDKRINKRLIEFVDDSSRHIQSSIAQLGDSRHVSKAYYRLLANDKVDSYAVLEEHLKQVQSRAAKHPVVLCLQDTTELNYSSKQSIEGLGRLCYDAQHGMYVHPTLMVTPEGLPLGITDLWSWSRKPKGEIDIKESTRWKEGYERVCELAQDQPKTRHVYIADREGDLLDIIEAGEHLEHPADYLIRAKHSRILADETKLFSITTEAYELGKLEFTTPRGRGKAARQVIQTVYAKRVQLKSKHWITIVIAQEAHPPKGSQAVVWRLITNRLVGDFLAACELINWYRKRWLIETFFNILKTGCQIENRLLATKIRLERLLMIFLIISYRILQMTMLSRIVPEQSCELLFSREEWRVAYQVRYRKKPPTKAISLQDMCMIVSGFGGHLGRKGDGDAGAKTLWKGLLRLADYLEAAQAVNGK
jgi:hypothetical protein